MRKAVVAMSGQSYNNRKADAMRVWVRLGAPATMPSSDR
jgi:hypothetical protein